MPAISTLGIQLKWGATASALTKVIDIKSFPDLGGAPTLHDVSTFINKMKVTIPGRQELDGLEFGYFLDADMANYLAVKAQENTELFYELSIGDNGSAGKFTWKGQHSTWVNGADGDAPVECTLQVAPSTDIEASGPSAG